MEAWRDEAVVAVAGGERTPTVTALEAVERRAWTDAYRAAGSVGFRWEAVRLGPGCALFGPEAGQLAFNRVFGLGGAGVSMGVLADALVEAYRVRGVGRFLLQTCPGELPSRDLETLRERGFRPHGRWVRLYREAPDPGDVPWVLTELDVVRAGPEHATAFGEIVAACFDYPEALVPWCAALPGRPGWKAFVALDGTLPVATAAYYARGEWAWMSFAATLPSHRGRGAHLALAAEMTVHAARRGCRHLVAETAEDLPDRPAPAWRNGRRLGFREVYGRANLLYETGA